jgi:hypothetical protein
MYNTPECIRLLKYLSKVKVTTVHDALVVYGEQRNVGRLLLKDLHENEYIVITPVRDLIGRDLKPVCMYEDNDTVTGTYKCRSYLRKLLLTYLGILPSWLALLISIISMMISLFK